jgi:hypothetical protein
MGGRYGEWRMRRCLRMIQAGYENVVTISEEHKHSKSLWVSTKEMGVVPCYMTIFRTREGAGKEGAARV